MLGYLFVVAVSLGAIMADHHCSIEDIRDVQHDWKFVWGDASLDARVVFGKAVFKKLQELDGSVVEPLKVVHVEDPDSDEFKNHVLRVLNGLDNLINLFDEQGVLVSQLDHLAKQHKERPGVNASHFRAFAKAFLEVLEVSGSCPNLDAWRGCLYGLGVRITAQLKK
uniref:Extracellular globin n=1 Tax=Macrobdella decora TaxID=6405 RepID=Q760Q1_MACDE|nr:hemoglobin, chain IIB [Macrobdella decora]